VTVDEHVRIAALPMPLRWLAEPQSWNSPDGGSLSLTAGPGTDRFVDPRRLADPTMNAPALVGAAIGDFRLSARVTVNFTGTYDAGVLILHVSDSVWAKLCFEYSPQCEPMVVSVVTREVSDDCNSFLVEDASVWLRIARIGRAFAFHASADGAGWQFIRHFALDGAGEPSIGFAAQSPKGEGCTVTFEQIAYEAAGLADLRSGL
jgi:regulation of enolase protein 1 (concanavalin A-like superfamily)